MRVLWLDVCGVLAAGAAAEHSERHIAVGADLDRFYAAGSGHAATHHNVQLSDH